MNLITLIIATTVTTVYPNLPVVTGGEIPLRGSFAGKVALVDTQSKMPFEDIKGVAAQLVESTGCNFIAEKSKEGNPIELKAKMNANLAAIIIDDPSQPTILVAPEEHWAIFNVSKVPAHEVAHNGKIISFRARAVKELIRTVSLLCGGGSSQFPGNMMNAATWTEIDESGDGIPYDMKGHYQRYLKALGVTPIEYTTYKKACREGWAPPPTNDVQKAVWDKVHAIPKNPMTIQYDPKKGR